ncbi:MAG: RNA 2',3'-cyclic phosphodiesterase [Gammaproteobacteria bacterium]|nr:RNA 2',3'-cyclic phosphodiesterase [Gammaproteobacteria bacterium]
MVAEQRKRLFIGIACQPGRAVQRVLSELRARAADPATGLRPVPAENLHITLKFLGMVPVPEIAMISQIMQQIVSRQRSLTLQLHGFGCFKQALWLGVKDNEELQHLAAGLDQALGIIGVSRQQNAFVPHLTVARLRPGAKLKLSELQATYGDRTWGELKVDTVTLFESETLPQGARYSRLFSASLGS